MMRWEGYRGIYVFHCHIIGHEDQAMMAQIEVAD
jgi:FtsP/CotA-like multicopper oxidase with cupredoxin domain